MKKREKAEEHVEAENAEAENAEAENAEAENTETENAETENAEAEHTETDNNEIEQKAASRKKTKRKGKRLSLSNILILSGVVLLVAAGGLFAYNRIYDYRAGVRAQALLDEMMMGIEWNLPPLSEMVYTPPSSSANISNKDTPPPTNTPLVVKVEQEEPSDELDEEPEDSGDASSSVWVAPSYTTIGIISIPKLNVRLPVISESSDYLLGISCCRLSGGYDPKPFRLVIAGHNIWSHFKGLDTFEPGDQIAFTTLGGETYFYSATENVALYKTEGADVLAATGWDITLITCKTDNTWRTVVRFVEITE